MLTDSIVQGLNRLGVNIVKVVKTKDPTIEDDLIELEDGYHISVHPDGYYLSLNRVLPDGNVLFGVDVKKFSDIQNEIINKLVVKEG